jgi:hypothetical protein
MTSTPTSPEILTASILLGTRAAGQPKTKADLPPELLALIHDHSVLNHGLPYLGECTASTDLLDTYSTRMLPKTLKNFAGDATAGVGVQDSHQIYRQSLGRTYLGRYVDSRPNRCDVAFFIPTGLAVGGTSTDSVIQGIRWGSAHDVSVGFYGGRTLCSLDGKEMLGGLRALLNVGSEEAEDDPNAPCPHLPGISYPVRDNSGKKTGDRQVAIGQIDGAHLAELSLVFDGSTPGASIRSPLMVKANVLADMDLLSRETAEQLEVRYRCRFSNVTGRRWSGWSAAKEKSSALTTSTPPPVKTQTTRIPARAYRI